MRALALTLDLDGPAEYAGIHNLAQPTCDPHIMYGAPLDRFLGLCGELGGSGTLFVIGRDVTTETASKLQSAAASGLEIANHSLSHDYLLSRRTTSEIYDELRRAQTILADYTGVLPTGFRAPGYLLSPALLDALEQVGFAYDSSVLPSPSYYAVKATVLGLYRLLGRRSTSLLGSPRTSFAPRTPYRPGSNPYNRGRRALLELPLAVATPARLPLTGASLLLAPRQLRTYLAKSIAEFPVVVINLHAVEFSDPRTDSLPSTITRHQPELQRPITERIEILTDSLRELAQGREILTCAEIAARLGA